MCLKIVFEGNIKMIEKLEGIHETVNFKKNTGLRLYDNNDFETYPAHWHTPMEIIMVLDGMYQVSCNHISFLLKEGDILLITPGVIHSMDLAHQGRRLILQADCTLLRNLKDLEATISIIAPALHLTSENASSFYKLIKDTILSIHNEYIEEAPLSESAVYMLLIQMLVLIGRNHTQNNELSNYNDSKQKEYTEKFLIICDYINIHCTDNLTLDEIAAMAGFSKYHFTRLFKQFTNISFYRYLNQKRIALAETLLIDPNVSVTEAALRSGFNSLSAFIRMFKIIKDCTPTEFCNMYSH